MHFWKCFSAFDPRGLPENIGEITGYRNGELEILIIHYGKTKEDTFKGIANTQNPDIDEDKTRVEWQGFKRFIYMKRDAHRHKIDTEIQSYKEEEKEKKEEALKRRKNFGPHDFLKEMNTDNTLSSVYRNCYKLFYYILLFPLNTACVERLFSKMKLIKTRLRNNLSQSTFIESIIYCNRSTRRFSR